MGSVFDLRGRLRAAGPRLRGGRELGVWSLFVAGAVGLELYARRADAPLEQIVSVAAFLTLAYQLWRRARPRLEQSARLASARRWIVERRMRFGVDLRGEPPLAPRLPRLEAALFAALVVAIAVLLLTRARWPEDVLRALRSASGLVASGLTAALWAALVVGTLSALVLPMLLVEARLRERRLADRAREVRMLWTGAANALALLLACFLLPAAVAPLLALAGVFSGAWLYLPGRPPLRFAWKRPGSGTPAALSAPLLLLGWRLFHFGVYLALVLVSVGVHLDGSRVESITSVLGLAFGWSLASASLLLALREVRHGWGARRASPSAFARPLVAVRGAVGAALRRRVRAALGAAGFDVCFDGALADAELRFAPVAAERGWPRRVTLAELSLPALHRALARRAELQARRRLRRGLAKLLRIARERRRERDGGIGHWVAPHLWFVLHLGRDGKDELDSIGPPYHTLLPRSARSHLLVVLCALQVDLLFVEDGVDPRSFQRVLSMTFEFYDMFGARRLEERHFLGLPGVRVLIEELCLDEPLRGSSYPEPDYEELARARVLHVFRDRGGDPERESIAPRRGRRPRADVLA